MVDFISSPSPVRCCHVANIAHRWVFCSAFCSPCCGLHITLPVKIMCSMEFYCIKSGLIEWRIFILISF